MAKQRKVKVYKGNKLVGISVLEEVREGDYKIDIEKKFIEVKENNDKNDNKINFEND